MFNLFFFLSFFTQALEPSLILSDLIKIKSVRNHEDKVVSYLSKVLDQEGIGYEVLNHPEHPQKKTLLATIGPQDKKDGVILMSHSDVVEAGESWSEIAFSGSIADGRVMGRGAIDMKGMLVMELMSFLSLAKKEKNLKKPLMFLVVADEESGGELGAKYISENFPSYFSSYRYVLNEGGFGIKDFPKKDKNFFALQVAEKGILGLKLKALGTSGHGSMPSKESSVSNMLGYIRHIKRELGAPSVTPMVEPFLKEMGQALGFPYSVILPLAKYPFVFQLLKEKLMEKSSVRAMLQNTFTVTSLHTKDLGPNVIPQVTQAYLDVRVLPSVHVEHFIDRLFEIAKSYQVSIEVKERSDSTSSSKKTPFFHILKETLSDTSSNSHVGPYVSPGATDNRYMRKLGLEAYGIIPILIPMSELSMLHGKNESLSLENLKLGTKLIQTSLERYLF